MKVIIIILTLIIIVLSGWIYFTKDKIKIEEKIIKVNTVEYKIKTDTITLIRPAIVDTQIIIKKYFEKINIERTFKVNDYQITLTDTLYYNQLHFGNLKIIQKPRINYYLSCNYSPLTGISTGVAIQKNRFIYSVDYSPFSKNIQFGIKYKLNK